MDISKSDAVAHLAKWHNSSTKVRAAYKSVTASVNCVAEVADVSPELIKITNSDCQMTFYFRQTSTFDYQDAHQPPTEANKNRTNQYPTIISIKFSGGDSLEIREYFYDA